MFRWLISLLLLSFSCVLAEQEESNSDTAYCTKESAPLSKQTPNTFFKVCPSQHWNRALGQPICGDGTAFSFYVTKPPQKHDWSKRILIEFIGGGACWDAQTCEKQANYLTSPSEKLDTFVGRSCTEAAAGAYEKAFNMLCSSTLGETDMSAYTTIIVPYCTQDCHSGDASVAYSDGDGNANTVKHFGAHNMMAVMRYIFKNFQRPSHIALTGCSAGGTALPLAYNLLERHYTKFGVRSTQISVLADSPVFLTPSYFLNNAFDNWNTRSLVGKEIGFNYNKWRYDEQYPVKLWDYILRKGSNRDRWGFISHYSDPTSQNYYKWMSGGNDGNNRRRLEQNNNINSQWYDELTASIQAVQRKHPNVKAYWYGDEEAHCTFGLYYPLQQDGFAEWAGDIVKEQRLEASPQLVPVLLSVVAAVLVVGSATYYTAHKSSDSSYQGEDGEFVKYEDGAIQESRSWNTTFRSFLAARAATIATCPVCNAYLIVISLLLVIILIREGFVHPLNNPSLGPSAMSLSDYGINNPSLIVYRLNFWRLLTSNFVCSGVLAFILVVPGVFVYGRQLERILGSRNLAVVSFLIAMGSNLVYAICTSGATCSSLAFILGLYAFSIGVRIRRGEEKCNLITIVLFTFLVAALFFPFNSWIVMGAAFFLGGLFSFFLFEMDNAFEMDNDLTLEKGTDKRFRLLKKRALTVGAVNAVLCFTLLVRLRRPDRLYLQPFYTGCDLKYAEDIGNIASKFSGNNDQRFLEGDDGNQGGNSYCAQFCVPHVASRGIGLGARKFFDFEITDGTCEAVGFADHVADKTFKYFSYSLDVEVFKNSDYNDE